MLIDDLREMDVRLGPVKIKDAIVFRINERADNFGLSQVSDELEPLPSLLPYNNMVIHFDGFCIWYFMEEIAKEAGGGYVIYGAFFSDEQINSARKKAFNITAPICVFLSYIDKINYSCTGMNIYYPHTKQTQYDQGEVPGDSPEDDLMSNSYKYIQAFLTILSCKNIRTDLEKPDEKIQKKRASKGKLPLVSYYVLKIQNKSHGDKSAESDLWTNRVHFCRGHMREYTMEAPLFGKLVGRFWIPPHVRGDKSKGVIMKDYEIGGLDK